MGIGFFFRHSDTRHKKHVVVCRRSAGEIENALFWIFSLGSASVRDFILYTLSFNMSHK